MVEGSVPSANVARPVDVVLRIPCSPIVSMYSWMLAIEHDAIAFGHYVDLAGRSQSHNVAVGRGEERRFASIVHSASSKY